MITSKEWKESGMIWNRYPRVKHHLELKEKILNPDLDMEDVKDILLVLLDHSLPVEDYEVKVILGGEL